MAKDKCYHEGESYTWFEHDARGIPLAKVCDKCVEDVRATFRPDVLTDPDYWADEEIG